MMNNAFDLNIDREGIARLIFDLPGEKINKLSIPVLEELESILDQLAANSALKVLVITSAKDGIFIAGADLKSFEKFFQDPSLAEMTVSMGHRVLNKLENLPFPSLAVINGACLGGGLELALACTFRIVGDNPRTSLALPETTLGIFPGWGGSQRLPRLVGFTQGLAMIVSGQAADAPKAFKIKLADAIYPSEFLLEKTEEFLKECLSVSGKREIIKRRKITGIYSLLFEKNFIGRLIVAGVAKRNVIKKTKGNYPAPLAAIKVVRDTYGLSLKKGLKKEIEMFVKCIKNGDFRYANNLILIFFNSEAIKKDPGLRNNSAVPQSINSVGVLGAGTMGNGIAWLMSYKDIPVRMKDINWEALGRGLNAAWDTYKTLIKIRKLKPTQADVKFHKIAGTIDYTGFDKLDLIVEAAVENVDMKHKIFKELETQIDPKAIVATNTSSYTIKELSSAFKYPERLVGMHFFNPPSRMPLVEIVAGEKTSPEAIATAVELCRELKKTPIVVGDCTGFLVNRVFVRGFSEVIQMLEEGVEMERLDSILLKFGLPMAPFVLADEVGNDINLKVFQSLSKAYPERIRVPPILEKVNAQGLLGKKTGKGFYIHHKKSTKPNPQIKELLTKNRGVNLSDQDIVDRLTLSMIHEASLCLEEKIVTKPGYLDIAMIYATGFPPFRGGLLRYADSIGIAAVVNKLKKLQSVYGKRYAPTTLLLEMEREDKTFY
jgi:3-hydroxyacyl-CoA dehydrogenase/enoyl-CoA hydratase/3-hydroxybutyryl-CoA epimerase